MQVDLIKCTGEDCPIKSECLRYTQCTGKEEFFFVETPFYYEDDDFECSEFWHKSLIELYKNMVESCNTLIN